MAKDAFTKQWITDNSIEIVSRYEKGILTIRGLHYQLVSIGMTNTMRHYKRVVNAMIAARWEGLIEFDAFKPEKLQELCQEAIDEIFDFDLYDELNEIEEQEREKYQELLKRFVNDELSDEA